MKFNWGTGILIVIITFILGVIAFFIFINNLDINLVEDNYYEKELAYQEKIDQMNNTALLNGEIDIFQEGKTLFIQFPELDSLAEPKGNVLFYRPSDPDKDITVPLQLNEEHLQAIDISKIIAGKWILKLDWEMGGQAYYYEEGIVIW